MPLDLQGSAHRLLGIVLNALGQHTEALASMEKAKMLWRQTLNKAVIERIELDVEKVDQSRRRLLAELTPQMLRHWREEAKTAPCPHPLALLAGAPRSGTTLLEQILGAHPQILAFDESLNFMHVVVEKLQLPSFSRGVTLKALNDLSAASRRQIAGRYVKNLLRELRDVPRDRLLLDKNPQVTPWLPVWLRLYPQSKIIIALRDPRDVVISRYFQHLTTAWGIVCFGSLEATAKHYADGMDVWLRLRELGGFDWIETRYEDVVADLQREGLRVTEFLGLPWHEAQAAYYETARSKYVYSPTYDEVRKPIYKTSVARWKHYESALAPLQGNLAKYCQAFGYG